ncbi:MAG: LPXTG cell wall anchor domain-containing protein [Mangrovibacterium sp.]
MKKFLLFFALLGFLAFGNSGYAAAQQDDLLNLDEDTVSIDDMDPVFYEAEQESGSNAGTIALVVAGVIIVGGGLYYFNRKKKQ